MGTQKWSKWAWSTINLLSLPIRIRSFFHTLLLYQRVNVIFLCFFKESKGAYQKNSETSLTVTKSSFCSFPIEVAVLLFALLFFAKWNKVRLSEY